MLFTRSDAVQEEAPSATTRAAKSQPLAPLPAASSSSSSSISSPHTPRRNLPKGNESPALVGLLTPVSSVASLSPAPYHQHKLTPQPATPQSPRIRRGGSLRRPLYPTSPSLSLELHLQPAQYFARMTSAESSRPASPERRARPLSPRSEHVPPRPPSRCESLLRDALRRADDYERSHPYRSGSRSPTRWAASGSSMPRSRPRGSSLLGTLSRADDGVASADEECFDDAMDCYAPNGRDLVSYRSRASAKASSPRFVLGRVEGNSADYCPYGSPSSPTPLPPSMLRTRTAPAVPRASRPRTLDDQSTSSANTTRPLQSPRSGRLSLPNTVIGGGGPSGSQTPTVSQPSNETSPKLRQHGLSPHEVVLRQKLTILLKAGSTSPDERTERGRNHQRSQSHGVTVVTSHKHHEDHPASVSPRSLAASSLSNSASDIARLSSTTPAAMNRRGSVPHKANGASSPSSPSEPMTPPPTPPFNARTASEVCKRMDGYVSFANVEGLGEPPGMDIDADPAEEAASRWGRWLRMLPWANANGMGNASEHDADQMIEHTKRS